MKANDIAPGEAAGTSHDKLLPSADASEQFYQPRGRLQGELHRLISRMGLRPEIARPAIDAAGSA